MDVKHADGSLKASEVEKQAVDDAKGTTKSAAQAESVEELRAQLEEANKKIARMEATEELRTQLEAAHEKIALLEQQVETLTAGRGLPEQGSQVTASMQVQSNGGAQPIVRGGPGGVVSPMPGQPPGTPAGPASLTPGGMPPPAMGQAPPPGGALAPGGLAAGPAQGKTITFCAKSLGKTPVSPKLPGGTVTINGLSLAADARGERTPIPTGTTFFFSPPDGQCKAKFEYENVVTACLQVGTGCTSDPAYSQDQSYLPCTFDTTLNQGAPPRGQTFQVTLTQIFPGAQTAEWAPTGALPQCPGGCFLYYDAQNKGVGACVVGGPSGVGLPGASAIASLLAVAFFLN